MNNYFTFCFPEECDLDALTALLEDSDLEEEPVDAKNSNSQGIYRQYKTVQKQIKKLSNHYIPQRKVHRRWKNHRHVWRCMNFILWLKILCAKIFEITL